MSKQPECKVCGNYINHGPVVCEECITEHDAAIARKAREDILKEISDYIDQMYPVPGPEGDYLYPSRKGRREVYDQIRSKFLRTTQQSEQEQPR